VSIGNVISSFHFHKHGWIGHHNPSFSQRLRTLLWREMAAVSVLSGFTSSGSQCSVYDCHFNQAENVEKLPNGLLPFVEFTNRIKNALQFRQAHLIFARFCVAKLFK